MSEPTVSEPLSKRLRAGGTIHSDDDNDMMREAADLIDALVEALGDVLLAPGEGPRRDAARAKASAVLARAKGESHG